MITRPTFETIEHFFEKYDLREYKKGQVFILNGETSDFTYYVISGRVKVYDVNYRGDEIILNVYKPPAIFPIFSLIDSAANKYIYEADTATTIRRAPTNEVKRLLESSPDTTLDLLKQTYSYLTSLLERQALLMAGSAKSRLIYELIIQCQHYSATDEAGNTILDIHEKDLAARAGLSRETVNREVGKLKRDNLIALDHHRIIIPDVYRLEQTLTRTN